MRPQIELTFRFVLGLSFLPERMRRWLFDKGTRAIEVLNATIFAIWGTVLLGDGGMLKTEHYKGFAVFEAIFGRKAWACAFLACAAFAVLGILCDARRCKVLGGYALLLGALTWALLSIGFVAAYPPVNTEMFVYAVISVMCFLSGEHVMYTVRQEDAASNKKQGGAACGQTP